MSQRVVVARDGDLQAPFPDPDMGPHGPRNASSQRMPEHNAGSVSGPGGRGQMGPPFVMSSACQATLSSSQSVSSVAPSSSSSASRARGQKGGAEQCPVAHSSAVFPRHLEQSFAVDCRSTSTSTPVPTSLPNLRSRGPLLWLRIARVLAAATRTTTTDTGRRSTIRKDRRA